MLKARFRIKHPLHFDVIYYMLFLKWDTCKALCTRENPRDPSAMCQVMCERFLEGKRVPAPTPVSCPFRLLRHFGVNDDKKQKIRGNRLYL